MPVIPFITCFATREERMAIIMSLIHALPLYERALGAKELCVEEELSHAGGLPPHLAPCTATYLQPHLVHTSLMYRRGTHAPMSVLTV
jgi:hypothetical protein